jgi:hypothetical protein
VGYLDNYLDRLRAKGNALLADAVKATADKITPEYIAEFTYTEHVVSLLFGNVQSGKTSHLFGLICSAADEGFKIFILLTTDINLLQEQTLSRVEKDLSDFCICGEHDDIKFIANDLHKPSIIVLKKNPGIIKRWKNTLASSHSCEGNALFIVDDEADAASLNTLVNKKRKSPMYSRLIDIEKSSSGSLYIQVTGTPQALLLQSQESGRRPYFTHYFPPGNGYVGGNTLFTDEESPYVILTDNEEAKDLSNDDEIAENGLQRALLFHLVSSAEIMLSGGSVSNFLIHPSMLTDYHELFSNKIAGYLNEVSGSFDDIEVNDTFNDIYENLKITKPDIHSFDEIIAKIRDVLENDEVRMITLNSKSKATEQAEYETGINVIVGGNSLGRGITFPVLQTTYYCRVSKTPQADTLWQHARMFGYDRHIGLIRVFMPPILYKLFSDINATNNSIISQIERKKPEDVKLHYPKTIKPSRKNVLDKETVLALTGNVDYFPLSPDNKSIETLDNILSKFGDDVYSVNLNIFIKILEQIISESVDWKPNNFIEILQSILSEKPGSQGKLIVRRGRDIGKGTGTLLSPNDRKLSKSITDFPVLTMYKVTGTKGWNGREIWIPNIKLPGDDVYYCSSGA